MKHRISSFLFSLALLLALFPTVRAASTTDVAQIQKGDIILLGTADEAIGFTAEWIVLDNAHTNTGDPGMFLLSRSLIGSNAEAGLLYRTIEEDVVVGFSDRGDAYASAHPGVLDYQGSDIQRWCEDFLTGHFSPAELCALFQTYKSDSGYSVDAMMGGTVDFDPAENILNGDRLFLLSAEEATDPNYGFSKDKDRQATFNGELAMWWLRSPHIPTFPLDVGMVFSSGMIMDFPVHGRMFIDFNAVTCARPACNLDTGKILAIQEVGKAENGATIWSLTLAEDGASATVQAPPPDDTVGHAKSPAGAFFRALLVILPVAVLGGLAALVVFLVKKNRSK